MYTFYGQRIFGLELYTNLEEYKHSMQELSVSKTMPRFLLSIKKLKKQTFNIFQMTSMK